MQVIDEQGRLFGLVNVIDALVVVTVLAVIAAGLLLVTGGEGPSEGRAYATVTFESQHELTDVDITERSALRRLDGEEPLNVTDVHRTAGSDRRSRYVAKVSIPVDDGLRIGPRYQFVTDSTRINGTIQRIDDQARLDVRETELHVVATAPGPTLPNLEPGAQLRVADEPIGEVVSVASYPDATSHDRTLRVGIRVRTVRIGESRTFAGTVLRPGARIPLWTDEVSVQGTVENVGATAPVGTPVDATITLAWEGVRPEAAAALETGLAESHSGSDAEVEAIEEEPAAVAVPTDSGDLVSGEHPRDRDVTITLSASTYRRDGTVIFHGKPLRIGRRVSLEFDRVAVDAVVTDFETDSG